MKRKLLNFYLQNIKNTKSLKQKKVFLLCLVKNLDFMRIYVTLWRRFWNQNMIFYIGVITKRNPNVSLDLRISQSLASNVKVQDLIAGKIEHLNKNKNYLSQTKECPMYISISKLSFQFKI